MNGWEIAHWALTGILLGYSIKMTHGYIKLSKYAKRFSSSQRIYEAQQRRKIIDGANDI